MEEKQLQTTQKANIIIGPTGGLMPRDFEGLWRLSTIFASSGFMPKGMERVESVFVAVQFGLEVGLSPMQSVQNIASINGRPTIWGDAAIGLVEASGLLAEMKESFKNESDELPGEMTAVCYCKRKGGREVTHKFSVKDAKMAELWTKNIWKKYPRRMLQMRARGFALRDLFADVLKGLILREEAMDYDVEMVNVGGEYQAAPESPQLPVEPAGADYTPQKLDDLGSTQNQQSEPLSAEKQTEKAPPESQPEPTGPATYKKWINMKTPDYFFDYVQKYHIDFKRSDDENKATARAKWERMELPGQPKCLGPWPEKTKPAPEAGVEKIDPDGPENQEYIGLCDSNPDQAMAARTELFGENREPRHMAELTGLIIKIEQLVDGESS